MIGGAGWQPVLKTKKHEENTKHDPAELSHGVTGSVLARTILVPPVPQVTARQGFCFMSHMRHFRRVICPKN